MTVEQLIACLAQFPPNMRVFLHRELYDCDARQPEIRLGHINSGLYADDEEYEEGNERIVVIKIGD